MRRIAFAAATLAVIGTAAVAAEISDSNCGTYAVQEMGHPGNQPDTFYRLSRTDSGWKLELKNTAGLRPGQRPQNVPWQDLTCSGGCNYRTATPEELAQYLPDLRRYILAAWSTAATTPEMEFACIQNATQAFCKYHYKGVPDEPPAHSSYVVMDLGTRVITSIYPSLMPIFDPPFLMTRVDLENAQDVSDFKRELQLIAQSEGAHFADMSAKAQLELDNPGAINPKFREQFEKRKSLSTSRPVIRIGIMRSDGVHLYASNDELPGYPVRLLFYEHSNEALAPVDARGFANRVVSRLTQRWQVEQFTPGPDGTYHRHE